MAKEIRYLPSGDCALTVEFGDRVDRALSARAMALRRALERGAREGVIEGVIETVPTFRSLMVHYDPLIISGARLRAEIEALEIDDSEDEAASRTVTLPVVYGGEHGPDLEDVAKAGGVTPAEAVKLHSEITHYVYMMGFAPGHPYLGDLPRELTLPRRETPRTRIPAGTVAIAVGQTVIYPFESPGGWSAIGRTPAVLFDIRTDPPSLLRAGDHVRFRPIEAKEYDDLAARPPAERVEIDGDGA
ncbi:5-oxoprolinase subunit PxpB [Pikeienuella sp. HZG-20]|uniref:5-oxoprolinase subunit PxpB n=1 Tax=Paludibacillus litoralis TaxID=3133267 RepID=UPI0030EBE51B